jgi:hypothetical protein
MAKVFPILLCCSLPAATSKADPKCQDSIGSIQIATYIDGPDLIANGISSPVGTQRFKGPTLKLQSERTKFWSGAFCSFSEYNYTIPNTGIPPNSVAGFQIGKAESNGHEYGPNVDMYFSVWNEAGYKTACEIKIFVDTNEAQYSQKYENLEVNARVPTVWARIETVDACKAAVPKLKIYNTGIWCGDVIMGRECYAKWFPLKYGTTFMVYFDAPSTSEAASIDGAGVSSNNTRTNDQNSPYDPVAIVSDSTASGTASEPASSSSSKTVPGLSVFVMLSALFTL